MHACARAPSHTATPSVYFVSAQKKIEVETAHTPETREKGLMHRTHLKPMHGMLFVFPYTENHVFWMRNTLIPLDMIFINHTHQVVGIVAQASPLTDTPRSVSTPSQYVLEIPGGHAQQYGIAVGDRVLFHNVPEPLP
jgi:uncharacterized membrane protein (UPF0127 family)